MTTLGIAGLAVLAFGGLLFILGMFVLGAGSVASMGKMFYSMLKNFSKSPSERLRDSDESDLGFGQGLLAFLGSMGASLILMLGGFLAFWAGSIMLVIEALRYFQVF